MNTFLPRVLIFTSLSFMFACSLFSVGDGGAGDSGGDKQAMFEQMYQQAVAVDKEISGMGGQWSNVEELLEKAQAEAKANNFDSAIALTKKAQDFSMIAKQQYTEQQKASSTLF